VVVEQLEIFPVPAPALAVLRCKRCPQQTLGAVDTLRLRGWRLPQLPTAAAIGADPDAVWAEVAGYCPMCMGAATSPAGYLAHCGTCTALYDEGPDEGPLTAVQAVEVAGWHECEPELHVAVADYDEEEGGPDWVALDAGDGGELTPALPVAEADPHGYVAMCGTCTWEMWGPAQSPHPTLRAALAAAAAHACRATVWVAKDPANAADSPVWLDPHVRMPDGGLRPGVRAPRPVETVLSTGTYL
jgi:hypothetical protein